jgi:putative addiction module killer protein
MDEPTVRFSAATSVDAIFPEPVDHPYLSGYYSRMNLFRQTGNFSEWLEKLKDIKAKARILVRIRSAELGHFGDCSPVGEGVSEMRLHFGPGYRLYFWKQENRIYWLLAGGDKNSQKRDIERATSLRREVEEAIRDENQHI